jgi:signal peptide peptidase SppA
MSKPEKTSLTLRLAGRILNTPLIVTRAHLDSVLSMIDTRIGINLPNTEIASPKPTTNRAGLDAVQTIAIIPVLGSLVHRSSGWDGFCGMTSYSLIRKNFRQMMKDAEVDAIIFDIDSPGGEVSGAFDLVDEIYNARGVKPLVAFVNEEAFSGGYALASAAEEIYTPRTGRVGSVGVIAVHVDRSEADKIAGKKYTPIYVGQRKNDGNPHEPLTTNARKIIQADIDAIYDIFIKTVARNRGISEESLKEMESGIYNTKDAINLGLIDGVKTFEEVVERTASKKDGRNKGMFDKKNKTKMESIMKDMAREELKTLMADLGYVSKTEIPAPVDEEAIRNAAKMSATKTEKERMTNYACEVIGLCEVARVPLSVVGKMIKEDKSIDDVKNGLVEIKADNSDSSSVVSTISADTEEHYNPLVADAKKRAKAAEQHRIN